MADDTTHSDARQKLGELINGIRIAMLTTVDADGSLRSRPMGTQEAEFDGSLWFFTDASSHKVEEIRGDYHVNVSYADADRQTYVSVSGRATLVRDRQTAERYWSPVMKAWFPGGLDDPNLALLRVEVDSAEYWDAPSSTMAHLYSLTKSLLTGERAQPGENETLTL